MLYCVLHVLVRKEYSFTLYDIPLPISFTCLEVTHLFCSYNTALSDKCHDKVIWSKTNIAAQHVNIRGHERETNRKIASYNVLTLSKNILNWSWWILHNSIGTLIRANCEIQNGVFAVFSRWLITSYLVFNSTLKVHELSFAIYRNRDQWYEPCNEKNCNESKYRLTKSERVKIITHPTIYCAT